MQMSSPYDGFGPEVWAEITQKLLEEHPLKQEEIKQAAEKAWKALWETKIGDSEAKIPLKEVSPPATVIGYFFEKLLAKELQNSYQGKWRGGRGSEKDLHFEEDPKYSIEVKSSGQLGTKIYGNRSYAQKVENKEREKKDKSGYYVTVNFHEENLNLVRFGWIDGKDWVPQKSETGQMAGLGPEVYSKKLVPIKGEYTLNAPITILDGIGPSTAQKCQELGVKTISDAIKNKEKLTGKLKKVFDASVEYKKSNTN